ncbi:hypothetical protein BC940DRAFT_291368 [Gongronella butleri]|nr:hypothetical protein BC940DRAFT_291368 [Gongronella butleri]
MGYCNRCGDILHASKCRKCGGKAVDSIARGAAEPRGSIIDRWQNQYANSILSGPEPTTTASTPLSKRSSMSSMASYATRYRAPQLQPKTCIYCHKAIPLGGAQVGKGDACHGCRVKLFDQKDEPASIPQLSNGTQCAECTQEVQATDAKFQHQGRTWHKDCIRCKECQQPMKHPTVLDVTGQSRCLACQRKSRPRAASFTTGPRPWLGPNGPGALGQIRTNAPRSPPSVASQASPRVSPASTSPLSRQTSPTTAPGPVPSASSKTAKRKTCRKCTKVLRGPRVRLPTPTGDTWYYHFDCLTCAACGDHFTGVEFIGDGKDVYHLHCRDTPHTPVSATPPPMPATPPSPTASLAPSTPVSPCSPMTPPPLASSPAPMPSKSAPFPRSTQSTPNTPHRLATPPLDYRCHTCSQNIQDKCLKNGSKFFHPNCFCCFECKTHLPSDQPFYEFQQEAYCEPCTRALLSSDVGKDSDSGTPWMEQDDVRTTASHIWKHRTKALPKLGGSKICPGCKASIAVMDDVPGPKASRWHKKCLRCIGCKKQMDSGAKVAEKNERWIVRCSDCSDKTPKPHYVR